MHCVYILQSETDLSFYIGATGNLKRRIYQHNIGNSAYSSTKIPYKLVWFCVFKNKTKAYDFERYLKSSSGYAFWKKRFI